MAPCLAEWHAGKKRGLKRRKKRDLGPVREVKGLVPAAPAHTAMNQ